MKGSGVGVGRKNGELTERGKESENGAGERRSYISCFSFGPEGFLKLMPSLSSSCCDSLLAEALCLMLYIIKKLGYVHME